jgi:hypothetical protein
MTLTEATRLVIRRLRYSPKTEESYVHCIRRFVKFHNLRHPRSMGSTEVVGFLNSLAQDRQYSASAQNQCRARHFHPSGNTCSRRLRTAWRSTRAITFATTSMIRPCKER